MKRASGISIILVISLFVFSGPASADFDETKWQYFKQIEFPQEIDSEYAFFQVDAEIFDGGAGNLQCLRVIDSEDREIPYQIVTKSKVETSEEFLPKLLNNSYLESQYNSFLLDFGEERPEVNRLTIVTATKNFTRRVSVEGSNNQSLWNTLVEEAYIFDFTRNIQSRHLRIEFQPSNFRYLRIKIHDDGTGPLEALGGKTYRIKTEPAETESWPLKIVERTENSEDRTTEMILDAGFRGIPLTSLDLGVTSRNYHRNVTAASSVDLDKWMLLGSGVIFNYDMPSFRKTDNELSFRENTDGRYFQLTIENYDDAPIKVSSVTGNSLVRRVIVPANGRTPYKVYFGNPTAKVPRYDLAHRMRYIETRTLPQLSLQPRLTNSAHVATIPEKPWTERHPGLLWTVMGAVIAVLALLIFNLIRKTPPTETRE